MAIPDKHLPATIFRQGVGRLLKDLTKTLNMAVGNEAGGESEESSVDVVTSFPSDP